MMRAASEFLLAYETPGADGLIHTSPSNAHEQQWDVTDPVTDLSARRALYQATLSAAALLKSDPPLVQRLQDASRTIPPFPRVAIDNPKQLLREASGGGSDMISPSTNPAATQHNFENIGLEPVWPYGLIGDDSPLTPLGRRTFEHRPYPTVQDWSFDPIQAARLGLSDSVTDTLQKLTQAYQAYPNGLSNWGGTSGEFYIEQSAMVALALPEALAQDYDGVLRIAPAVPRAWDMAGTVYLQGHSRIYIETAQGNINKCVFEAGLNREMTVRSPWAGSALDIVDDTTGVAVPISAKGNLVRFHARADHAYIIRRAGDSKSSEQAAPLAGEVATKPKRLGSRVIGLGPS
jgi:hypothetical protein